MVTSTKPSPKTKSKPASRTGRRIARQSEKPMDAIKLLKQDHKEVKEMFSQYEHLEDDSKKEALAEKICQMLMVHAQIEEELFYPAARQQTEDDDLVDEAAVEHATAKQLISEIQSMSAGDDLYDAKVKVLGEYIDHHVKEEEHELFPECRDSGMDFVQLGQELAARKAELLKQKN